MHLDYNGHMDPDKLPPPHVPFQEGYLPAGDGHQVWYAQYGNPDGIALLWLHGGPGSGSGPRHVQLFDLARYRLIIFDQRGCGRSMPLGETACNDTRFLVEDICRLQSALGIERFVLGGGSWGAALALAYAAEYRETVQALLLRAAFLAEDAEIDAFFQPAAEGDPAWEAFAALAPSSERRRLLPYYADQLATASHDRQLAIARAWSAFQQCRELGTQSAPAATIGDENLIARYRIQAHYLRHGCFLAPHRLLDAAGTLGEVPVAILHGSADRVCPVHNAHRLHERIAGSELRIVRGAGHDPFHTGMAGALTEALDRYAKQGHFHGWGSRHARG